MQRIASLIHKPFIVVGALATLMLSACATTAPRAKFSQPPSARIAAKDDAKVTVVTAGDASMLDYEKGRLAERIQEKLKAKSAANSGSDAAKSYAVEVTVTRYEKGNAFARAMLVGLGQIHIDASVAVVRLPDREKAGEFTIKKTFAWGGLYGGFTSMEDVEKGFAEGVAAALTGQAEESTAPKTTEKTKAAEVRSGQQAPKA